MRRDGEQRRAWLVTRFSGHESFACRYAWLPKAYRELVADPDTSSPTRIARWFSWA